MKTLKVAGAIIYRDGRIMAAHRSGSHGHVGWEFPGGKLESGETTEQALQSHLICFAAERSRLAGGAVVDID